MPRYLVVAECFLELSEHIEIVERHGKLLEAVEDVRNFRMCGW